LKVIDLVGTFITEHFFRIVVLPLFRLVLISFLKAKEVAFYRFFAIYLCSIM